MGYEKVPDVQTNDVNPVSWFSLYAKISTIIGMVVFLFLMIMTVVPSNTNQSNVFDKIFINWMDYPMEERERACTFEECYDTSCDWNLAPHTCLRWNGGPHGGCSQKPWNRDTCTEGCDLSGCIALDIPEDYESCSAQCDDEWCAAEERLCGSSVPYQCTDGASKFGCNDDPMMWTLIASTSSCSTCCDARTC